MLLASYSSWNFTGIPFVASTLFQAVLAALRALSMIVPCNLPGTNKYAVPLGMARMAPLRRLNEGAWHAMELIESGTVCVAIGVRLQAGGLIAAVNVKSHLPVNPRKYGSGPLVWAKSSESK